MTLNYAFVITYSTHEHKNTQDICQILIIMKEHALALGKKENIHMRHCPRTELKTQKEKMPPPKSKTENR